MRKTFCDLCGCELVEQDVRYIDFSKVVEEKTVKIHPALEICPACIHNVHKKIVEKDATN